MTETPSQKAHRLVDDGRVEIEQTNGDGHEFPSWLVGVRRFTVRGDSDTYRVRWYPEAMTCTCPAMSEFHVDRCSHVLAAILAWSKAHPDGNVVNVNERRRNAETP